jgi:outer membrane lipoprotein carrier protein
MQRRPLRFWTLAALLLVLAVPTVQAEGEARAALDRFLDGLETFTAAFEQTLVDETGWLLQASDGRLALALPDRLRWEVEAPYAQQIVADGEFLWTYDPELRQATVREADAALAATPLVLLTRPERLDAQFETRADGAFTAGLRLELVPRGADRDFTEVALELTAAGELLALEFIDVFGQRSRLAFRDAVRNGVLEQGLFVFQPPPGVDVYRP